MIFKQIAKNIHAFLKNSIMQPIDNTINQTLGTFILICQVILLSSKNISYIFITKVYSFYQKHTLSETHNGPLVSSYKIVDHFVFLYLKLLFPINYNDRYWA